MLRYMSMASLLAGTPRRIPRQQRGERRVAQLLDAAACEIAATGYEAATMSAIAERARAPIGSLYQFFPNKQAVAHALRMQLGKDYEALLIGLEARAKIMSLERLAGHLVEMSVTFVERHPAFLALLDAPSSTRAPLSLRRTLRRRLAQCFCAIHPELAEAKALQLAAVALQMMKGLNQLYAELPAAAKRQVIGEYRTALSCYLSARLAPKTGVKPGVTRQKETQALRNLRSRADACIGIKNGTAGHK